MAVSASRHAQPPAAARRAAGRWGGGVDPESPTYKWWVAGTVMLNVLAVLLSIAAASMALPAIMTTLSMSLDEVQWVMTAYMIASAVVFPTVGWLGNVLGNRNLLLFSVALFVVGSVLCGLAWNGSSLIAFRILQGMGGGPVLPMALLFVTQAFPPPQRGLAVGLFALGGSGGLVIGPLLGGYLTEYMHWRMVFYVNLIPGLIGILLIFLTLPQSREKERRKLDAPGLVALVAFLVSLLLGLSLGRQHGWDSAFIQRCFVIAAAALAALVAIELSRKQPLIELRLLANPAFAAAMVVVLVSFMGFYCTIFLPPLMLQRLFHYEPLRAGILILPGSLAMAVMMATIGRLTDLLDRRVVIVGSLVAVRPVVPRLVVPHPGAPRRLARVDQRGALPGDGDDVRPRRRRRHGRAAAGAGAHGLRHGVAGAKRPGAGPGPHRHDDAPAAAHDVLQWYVGAGTGRLVAAVARRRHARPGRPPRRRRNARDPDKREHGHAAAPSRGTGLGGGLPGLFTGDGPVPRRRAAGRDVAPAAAGTTARAARLPL